MSADRFAARFPVLYHVTDRAALPSIARHGLLSAAALCDLLGADAGSRRRLLTENRDRYGDLSHPVHGVVSFRRQSLRDASMSSRLIPGLSPAAWREFINGHVFLFADRPRARRLAASEPARDQVMIAWQTAGLIGSGIAPFACRTNNGFVDRLPPSRRRLRGPADYVAIADWPMPLVPAEIAAREPIPANLRFAIVDGRIPPRP